MSFTQLENELAVKVRKLEAEIERLRADKTAISQTASDYLHDIERLRGIVDELRSGDKQQEIERLQELLRSAMMTMRRASPYAFCNGVEHSGVDEGHFLAGQLIDEIRRALDGEKG